MLPDLLSLSDPFSGSVEESAKGVCVSKCIPFIYLFVFVSSKEFSPKPKCFHVVVHSLMLLRVWVRVLAAVLTQIKMSKLICNE